MMESFSENPSPLKWCKHIISDFSFPFISSVIVILHPLHYQYRPCKNFIKIINGEILTESRSYIVIFIYYLNEMNL